MAIRTHIFGYGQDAASQTIPYPKDYICDAEADLPGSGFIAGSRAFCIAQMTHWYAHADNAWTKEVQFVGLSKLTVGAVQPPSPVAGDLWVDTS